MVEIAKEQCLNEENSKIISIHIKVTTLRLKINHVELENDNLKLEFATYHRRLEKYDNP
ncbi:MAG: hypothetical protein OXC46_08750 [Thaumarchaeota archaeon]|nr:hypothetical protein [Nitrososphaerota archaeon]